MKQNNWHGILTIIEIQHKDFYGNILWEQKNINNILHQDGEEFLLRAAFIGGQNSTIIPANYYLGLDNRATISVTDTIDDIIGEPSSGGYERQAVSSSDDFSMSFENDHFVALSPIVVFRSTSGNWGPCANLFLTTASDDTGYLISTAALDDTISLTIGDNVTMRIGMRLKPC